MDVLFLSLIILVVGPALLLVLALLIGKPNPVHAHGLLAGLIAMVAYLCTVKSLVQLEQWRFIPTYLAIPLPVGYLVGPLLYFYFRASFNGGFRYRLYHLFHLVPFLICFLLVFPIEREGEFAIRQFFQDSFFSKRWFLIFGTILSWGIYLYCSSKQLSRKQQSLEQNFSNLDGIRLDWLRLLIGVFGILWIGVLLFLAFGMHHLGELLLGYLACWSLYAIAWFVLKKSPVLWEIEQQKVEEGPTLPRYQTSSLNEEMASTKAQEVLCYLEASHCYRNSNLKLQDLARGMRINEYQMSQILNVGLRENFYWLINRFRIDEAKRLLIERREASVLEIAYEVGFNSKSAFNRAFKAHTGLTPSAYRLSAA